LLSIVCLGFFTQCAGTQSRRPPKEARQAANAPANFRSAAGVDETARFLAGMPGPAYAAWRRSREWQQHQHSMDSMFANFTGARQNAILRWQASEVGGSSGTVFYPFSGPDYLYAWAFFPNASRYILCGLEPAGELPDLSSLSNGELGSILANVRTSLQSNVYFSYFITKDMKLDLGRTRIRGSLPLVLMMMARTGHRIQSVEMVDLTSGGTLAPRSGEGGSAPGFHVTASGPGGGTKHVYYFQENLANGSLSGDQRLLRFAHSQGMSATFLKSASYLLHSDGFSVIREAILRESSLIVQDPSGVPFRSLVANGWKPRVFGSYSGTLDMFKSYNQPDLGDAYRNPQYYAGPLPFGVGYEQKSMIVARR
jgi:hypothetical protein